MSHFCYLFERNDIGFWMTLAILAVYCCLSVILCCFYLNCSDWHKHKNTMHNTENTIVHYLFCFSFCCCCSLFTFSPFFLRVLGYHIPHGSLLLIVINPLCNDIWKWLKTDWRHRNPLSLHSLHATYKTLVLYIYSTYKYRLSYSWLIYSTYIWILFIFHLIYDILRNLLVLSFLLIWWSTINFKPE